MPRHLVEAAVEDFTTASGLLGLREFDHGRTQEAVRLLMETFNVNAPVAEIRLEQLFPASRGGQPML